MFLNLIKNYSAKMYDINMQASSDSEDSELFTP